MATVSVLVVNFNGRELLATVLQSLKDQIRPADEIIVVDNASTDDSVQYVREHFPEVTVIASPVNTGFSEGNNLAASAAHGDYFALLNSDAIADPHWLAELLAVMDSDPRIGAAVPKIYCGSSNRIEQAGALFNNLANIWGRDFNRVDKGQDRSVVEVPAFTACAGIVRRAALEGDALFDPAFFMYHEELDLSIRLRGHGYSIVLVPTARVHHAGMQSITRSVEQPSMFQQFYCNRNRVKILAKYYPARELLRSLPLIALSLLYWNGRFLRDAGVSFFTRAVVAQLRYAWAGLVERSQARSVQTERWLPWMLRQNLRQILDEKAAQEAAVSSQT